MGIFDKRSDQEKLKSKQAKLTEKVEKEFSKAKEVLSEAGFDHSEAQFALRAHPASLGALTRSIWVLMNDRIVKVSSLPPAYSKEIYLVSELESISVSSELIPTVAIRHSGRYLTFKADSLPAQYLCGLVSEMINKKR
jgi:hypothetical protein